MKISHNNPARTFACIFWVDNPENNTRELLCDQVRLLHLQQIIRSCAISPLHSPDSEDSDESAHKSHYHILFTTFSTHRASHLTSLLQQTHCNFGVVQKVSDKFQYYRYLTHQDHPKKEQFDCQPLLLYNFRVPTKSFVLTPNDEKVLLLAELGIEHKFTNILDFKMFLLENHPDLVPILARNPNFYLYTTTPRNHE